MNSLKLTISENIIRCLDWELVYIHRCRIEVKLGCFWTIWQPTCWGTAGSFKQMKLLYSMNTIRDVNVHLWYDHTITKSVQGLKYLHKCITSEHVLFLKLNPCITHLLHKYGHSNKHCLMLTCKISCCKCFLFAIDRYKQAVNEYYWECKCSFSLRNCLDGYWIAPPKGEKGDQEIWLSKKTLFHHRYAVQKNRQIFSAKGKE